MIIIHIGILLYPVKDLAERGIVFSKYMFFFCLFFVFCFCLFFVCLFFWSQIDSEKINRSITTGILLHLILQNDYNMILLWLQYYVNKVKVEKAGGPDGISARLIKEFSYELSKPLTDILNQSYREGTVPSQWKKAAVVPIPKAKPALGKIKTSFPDRPLCQISWGVLWLSGH